MTTTSPVPAVRHYDIKVSNPFVPDGAYKQGLTMVLPRLFQFLSEGEKHDIIDNKLRLRHNGADQAQYIQGACELTICSWFANQALHTSSRYQYELQVVPPKDVDCALWYKNIQFNLEVKCADYRHQNQIDAGAGLKVNGFGRLDDFEEFTARLAAAMSNAPDPVTVAKAKHMDCKLKDFLLSSQEKFGCHIDPEHLNVLYVCVDHPMDMQKWLSYLQGPRGLFTPDSFEPPASYANVDVVVLTNLYHRHHDLDKKSSLSDHWILEAAFNIAVANPASTKTQRLFAAFAEIAPLDNAGLERFAATLDDLSGKLALSYYANEQISRGIHKFQGYA
ncbi:hypothetical protein RugamoR57_03500 [Duganella caerulea]|uniref:hypothetical protein n=1 Tax=Duganella caerulea TaxID=2885762 RepID=UPI0030E91009